MRHAAILLVVLGIGLLAPAGTTGAEETSTRTLTGAFEWSMGAEGELEARFTPTGPEAWDVAFYFEFQGRPHVYSGKAAGKLTEGLLSGEVKNDDKRRSFAFEGNFEDGKFRGTHAETTGGRSRKTGTLRLES